MKEKKQRSIIAATFIVICALLVAIPSLSARAADQKWPTSPIRFICSAAAGGVLDTMTRGVAPYMSAILGVPIVVENMPGAGTRIANQYVFDAKPDGYTILFTNNSELTVGEIVYNPRYKTEDFTYIDTFFVEGPALIVKYGSPYDTLSKFIAAGKQAPIKFGTIGTGGYYHLQALLLQDATGMKMTIVPYSGGAPIIADVLGNHIDGGFTGLGIGYAMDKEKKLYCLTQVSKERDKSYPDIPAITEVVPNFQGGPYIMGLNGPPRLPADIAKRLGDAYRKAIDKTEFKEWARKVQLSITPLGAAEFKKRMIETKAQYAKYKDRLKSAAK
jgi:tripartite-type tricarboxylate transporter receptor subunit TctC